MKKSTKLLSVILAILMIFSSLSVASFAVGKTNYKTVEDLEALKAYNPYGAVTRLTTEERLSILFDQLDILLGELNINMGTMDLSILGKVEIDLRSINALCKTVDSVQTLVNKNSLLLPLAKVINYIDVSTWQSGMTRENTSQFTIVSELFEFISANELLVNRVLVEGLEFGVANGFLPFDREGISTLIQNLPSTIKTLIFPLMARPDATVSELSTFTNTSGNGGVLSVLDKVIPELLSKPMLWTSYRVNANGDDLKYTAELPTAAGQTSRYFVVENGGEQISQYDYNFPVLLGSKDNVGKWTKTVTYTKTLETEGGDTYVYAAPTGYSGDQTLKWYKNGDKGYLLPSVRDAINNGTLSFSVNGTDSALGLLYKFIPYVFAEMAPVVLNGSVKKLLAGALGVSFAEMTAAEVEAAKGLAGAGNFFTKPQESYLWEYSDYKVIDGVPYYRFEDTYFKGTLPENLSTYYYMFNWDWKITDDFVNEFIPTVDGTTIGNSAAGYSSILDGLNAFVYKVINTVLVENFEVKGQTYNLRTGLGWENGGLDKLVDNVLSAARYAFGIAPKEIFDEYYNDPVLSPYYNMMMTGTKKQALTGLACAGIKLLMPQAQLPTEAKLCKTVGTDSADDVSVLALGSVVLRELCTQFMPQYNFDALIYADYSTKTILTGADYDANYWLDTALNIGMDFGMYYLRSLTDLGEDDDAGYYSVMSNLKAIPSNTPKALVYKAGGTYVVEDGKKIPAWQYKLDWVLDWGLSSAKDWTWSFEKYIDCGSTVDLATYQDPWAKLNTIILKILPLDQLLDGTGVTTASNTWLENILRGKLVNGINSFDLPLVASAFKIPNGLLRNANVLTQAVTLVKGLLNVVFYKLAGNYDIIPAEVKTIDDVFNQDILVKTLAGTTEKGITWHKHKSDGFIAKLKVIVTNGLLDPLLPIVGLFLGWKTGAQDFNDPSIYFTTSGNDTYLHSAATNTLKIANKSSGMLEKHRNSNVVDNPYVLTINSIEADEGVTVAGQFPQTLNPGETIEMKVTVPADTESVATFKVNYSITGKDGKAIGSEQTKVVYARLTSTWDEENNMVSNGKEDSGIFSSAHKEYTFTKDLFTTVTTLKGEAQNSSSKQKNITKIYADPTPEMSENFMQYFESQTNLTEAEWPEKIGAYEHKTNATASGKLYKAKAGVTSATEIPYGYYDGGQIAVQFEWNKTVTIKGKVWAIWDYDFVYYNDYDIENVAKSYINKNLKASDFGADAQADFAAYETALKQVKFLADAPKTTMYADNLTIEEGGVMVHIPDAIAALDSAYEKLMKNPIVGDVADVNTISDAIDAIAEAKGYEIDYENYELYEFFAYDKAVKAGYKMIDSTKGPAKPENYIEGENLSQAVIEAIAAAKGGNIKTGIDATVSAPSEEAMTKYNDALANFTAPVYSTVNVEDTIARINYYFGFMDANMKTPVVKDFLNQEISIAEAQNYVQGNYSTDSWAAYQKALADAKAVQADADARQSQIFDAKYELMKAQNDLLPKSVSMKDNGYLDGELSALIEQANTIVNHSDLFTVKANVDATEAWKQLVQALGVEYNVNVDGTDYEGILYKNSALDFKTNDRLNSNKEKAKVDAACTKLRTAIGNFVSSVTLDPSGSGVVNQVAQDVKYIQGITPGTVTTADAILKNIKASNAAAKLAVTPSKSNGFGTGAMVKASIDGVGVVATYYVVVYGDVNGDGVVDAFDAFAVDKNVNGLAALDGVYAKAADADQSDAITVADLTPIMSAAVGNVDAISQTR
mgnify:CR=1 FL=1